MRFPGLTAFRFDSAGDVEAFPERQTGRDTIVDLYRRTVQPLALQALGREALHGSAVRTPAGLIGFCGERESGKSTIAYALSSRPGHVQFADDTIVLEIAGSQVRAVPLPFDPRLRSEAKAFFLTPGPQRLLARSANQNRRPPNGFAPQPASTQLPRGVSTASTSSTLDMLFVLKRMASGKPFAERLTGSAAFAAVLAHAHAFDPEASESRRRIVTHYLEVANAVPIYALRFAPGLHALDALIACIEETVESEVGAAAI